MILIDDRQGSKDLISFPPLSSLYSSGACSLDRLDSADVVILGNGPDGNITIAVEVKSTTDLLDSCKSGRLQATQIAKMFDTYDMCWLLYYGDYRKGSNGELEILRGQKWHSYPEQSKRPLPYAYLRSRLLEISCSGMHYEHVDCPRHKVEISGRWLWKYNLSPICEWIVSTSQWLSRPWDSHKGFRTLDETRGKLDVNPLKRLAPDDGTYLKFKARAEVAAKFPGVRFERAVKIAQHFGSVREMVNAERCEYEEIEGVGKVIAKNIDEFLS